MPRCRAILAEHRATGKRDRVGASHVARKLVHILHAVLSRERPYAPPAAYATVPAPAPEVPVES